MEHASRYASAGLGRARVETTTDMVGTGLQRVPTRADANPITPS